MVNVGQKVFLFRALINQLVVLFHLKEFNFPLILPFSTHSGFSLIPGFPRACCSQIPRADAPPASAFFAEAREVHCTDAAPGTAS